MAYIGPGIDNGYRSRFIYTATAGQTSFSGGDANGITLTYTDSEYLDVYQNGVLLVPGDDYAATTGTTVVLVQGASLNDKVEMIQYQAFGVADTVSRADGGAFGGNISTSGTLTVTGTSTLTGTVTANGDMVLGGTTPTLTIGDAGAEDAKIVFDGNAQDYHIGLDDSADTLTIGKGSTLGTTTSMAFDANGIITKPLQPAFLAQSANNDQTNLTLNASTAVAFGTEIFDNNSDFTPSTGDGQGGDGSNVKAVFTAPVTGKYHLNFNIRLDNLDTVTQFTMILLITSNRTLQFIHGHGGYAADVNYMSIQGTHLVDMDAGDTASLSVNLPSLGTAQMDINSNTSFSGYLVA